MSNSIRPVRYTQADRDDVFAFLRSVYPPGRSEPLIRQWDWKYDANPFKREAEPYIVVLKDGRRIVGLFGGVPLRCVVRGEERWLSHGGDWVIDPHYRDRGLSRLLWEGHEFHRSLRFSWVNEYSFQKGRSRVRMDMARLAPLVKPIDFSSVIERMTGNSWLSRPGGALVAATVRLVEPLLKSATVPNVTIERTDTFDERFDALWRRVCQDYPVMIVRDQRYLSWRFLTRPDAVYTVLTATRGGDLLGYLVVRSADRAGERWGYLVDFLVEGKSPELLSMLIRRGVECLRQDGVKAISCRAVVPPYRRPLYALGFLPLRWGPRGYIGAYVRALDPAYLVFRNVRSWFVTMADGDLELDF
jgi:hypothetical protein